MRNQILLLHIFGGILMHITSLEGEIPGRACETFYHPGDAIIGGIFPIYRTKSSTCDGELRTNRITMVQALSYAVDAINRRQDILENVTLGFEVRNDCSNEEISLWTMVTMTSYEGNEEYKAMCPNHERENAKKVFGVIGTSRSSTSLLAAKVGGVYAVPVVSYCASSDEFSNYDKFPYFFRTISPDKFQVGAIVDILAYYDWKYIALFYSIDTYGIHGARQIRTLAEDLGICVAINLPVSDQPSAKDVADIADKLQNHEHVSVIVTFALWESAQAVLEAIKDYNIQRKFTFIGSDGWGPDVDSVGEYEELLLGGLFVRVFSPSTPTFHDYYSQLPYHLDQASEWYRRKLDEIELDNSCTDWSSCPIPEPHLETRIIDGVYALAHALDASVRDNCDGGLLCDEGLRGSVIQSELLRVKFLTERNSTFQFDENGDKAGKYQIKNWQKSDDGFRIVDVGIWDPAITTKSQRLTFDEDLVQWGTEDNDIPTSVCVEKCKPGYTSVPIEKQCCWGCQKCVDYAIVVSNSVSNNKNDSAACQHGQECPEPEWPDVNFTSCIPIKPSYISPISSVFIVSVVFAGIGLTLTIIAGVGLWYYADHSLIKASSRELCAIHIFGMSCTCLVVPANLMRPSDTVCSIIDAFMSLCVCVTFAPLLLKVNRIWRIFNSKKVKKPKYSEPKHRLCFAIVIIVIQVAISCISIFFASSKPAILFPPKRAPHLEIYCQFGYGFIVSSAYNMLIITTCCYFAFRARKVPSNFNESKFIGISVYSTFIVCVAGTVVYSVANDVAFQIGTLNVILLFNTYLTLSCLYIPKLYAIYTDSEGANQTWRTKSTLTADSVSKGSNNKALEMSQDMPSSTNPTTPSE